ncbi:MAG: hypothetical protein IJJ76_03480 [Ruminococcus sp.]|nr:hypothetical protein [Ruminococcus sp.]MBR0528812.1 hypothetical protein [Ruminococcus sp.]
MEIVSCLTGLGSMSMAQGAGLRGRAGGQAVHKKRTSDPMQQHTAL